MNQGVVSYQESLAYHRIARSRIRMSHNSKYSEMQTSTSLFFCFYGECEDYLWSIPPQPDHKKVSQKANTCSNSITETPEQRLLRFFHCHYC